ncbi:hypothetical protein CSE16_02590 [Solibacillus sp. R5-41]|uniref:S-layer homology domain-containing protein n=1 Tax=Solibacillus sp. R5-41 TaxID=2048654 RepID=UPI000C12648E|nr:S-layer homology domain-containing protein [Solibacillus sp. R5-41]ATP38996.1 hypothetical protein CSE16_02590 [Solibacillus sp. R5-41]
MTKSNKSRKFIATSATAALVASAIVPVASAAQINDFNSISQYAQEAVQDLNDRGVIKGDQKGNFNPKNPITRAEAATILTSALGLEGSGSTSFNDVKKSAWYYDAIDAAVSNGVFQGQGAGKFNPSANLTRSEAAIILVDAFGLEGSADLSEFKDSASVKSWATEALEIAVANGVMKGDGGNLKPNASISRQEFAVMYHRTEALEVTEEVSGSVKAINATTVEVTFEEDVTDVKALDFAIEGLTISNAVVKQTNKKTVVLTTSAQTADVEYTVTVNGEKVGSFKGVSAVVPTKVDLVSSSVQGKLGQQVSVQAKVTVAAGQSAAGIPVTFSIPGNNNDAVYPTVTGEAITNADGVATYTYTRYGAGTDAVTAYATGDRSKFSTGYVFWGVDTILTITEVTEGATINNGANKTYKVTYKHPTTGKPVSGKTLNVGVKENIDVTVDKLQNVTVNGTKVVQTSDANTKAAQIKTDSKGEATFTVSGSNAEATPVVFEAAATTVTNSNGTVTTTGYSQEYTADKLQATAAKVKFGAVQADYTIELKRDGGEVAATGLTNGRKYNVVVKTKDGKLAANETVNVAFNENIDGVISTVTSAKFVKIVDGKQVSFEAGNITVKTNSKGEASFVIGTDLGSNFENTYATPIAWIDINNQSGKDANLDKGEPTSVAPISYFQAAYLEGSKLVSKNAQGDTEDKFVGKEKATFKVELTNQSGKAVNNSGYVTNDVSYTVYNTGANNVFVNGVEIAPNRVHTLIATNGEIIVEANEKGESTSVKVLATGVAKHATDNTKKDFAFTAKEATATFTSTTELTNLFTGTIKSFNTDKQTIVFNDKDSVKDPVKYAGETDKKYVYKNINGAPLSEKQFVEYLDTAKEAVKATYEVKDDVITFYIQPSTGGDKPVNELTADKEAAKVALAAAIKTETDTPLLKADYTPETFVVYEAALTAAKAVNVETASTSAIQKATTTLAEAKKALKPSTSSEAEKAAAKAALDVAIKAVKEEDYKSPAAVKAFVKAATEVLNNPASTTADYNKAKSDLAANLATLEKVVLGDAVAPTAVVTTSADNKVVTITFTSNVTVPAGTITVGTETGTIAAVDNNKELTITLGKALAADGTATITVKTPATATVKAGEFKYEVKYDFAKNTWTATETL